MAEAIVIYDAIRYTTADGQSRSADKGDKIQLTDAEFKRLKAMDAVAAPKSKDAKQAQAEAELEASGATLPPPPVEPEPEPESPKK